MAHHTFFHFIGQLENCTKNVTIVPKTNRAGLCVFFFWRGGGGNIFGLVAENKFLWLQL